MPLTPCIIKVRSTLLTPTKTRSNRIHHLSNKINLNTTPTSIMSSDNVGFDVSDLKLAVDEVQTLPAREENTAAEATKGSSGSSCGALGGDSRAQVGEG